MFLMLKISTYRKRSIDNEEVMLVAHRVASIVNAGAVWAQAP